MDTEAAASTGPAERSTVAGVGVAPRHRWAWIVAGVVLAVLAAVATFVGPWALIGIALVGVASLAVGQGWPDRRPVARRVAVLCAVVVGANAVLVVTGIPGLRPPVRELYRVADKIDAACGPGTATVDVWRGGIAAMMTPDLTPDEARLLYVNGKVLCVASAIR